MAFEIDLLRVVAALGIPGVALGMFFLLLRRFEFRFARIGKRSTAAIAILFLLLSGLVTLYALHRWAPTNPSSSKSEQESEKLQYVANEEEVTYEELLVSLPFDIVKVNAHTHWVGVGAEYYWIRKKYPGSKLQRQSLAKFQPVNSDKVVYFDIHSIRLSSGREKEVYFDISDFYDGVSSPMEPMSTLPKSLDQLYR